MKMLKTLGWAATALIVGLGVSLFMGLWDPPWLKTSAELLLANLLMLSLCVGLVAASAWLTRRDARRVRSGAVGAVMAVFVLALLVLGAPGSMAADGSVPDGPLMERSGETPSRAAGTATLPAPAEAGAQVLTGKQQSVLAFIAVIAPVLVAILKKMIPGMNPRWLPWIAIVLGTLLDVGATLTNLGGTNGLAGALMGMLGVGLREVVDQSRKAAGLEA